MAQSRDKVKSHHIWSGQIRPLIDWSSDENGFHLDKFQCYLNIFDRIFEGNCDDNIDLVRRALLTCSLVNYPTIQRNEIRFGWKWDDWHQLIWCNLDAFGKFFTGCIKNADADLQGYLESLCDEFPSEQDWAEFVHHPYLLEYCNRKHIICDDSQNLILVKNIWAKPFAVKNAHLLYALGATWKSIKSNKTLFDEKYPQWHIWYYPGQEGNCVVIENQEKDVVIDIVCSITECTFNLFCRIGNEDYVRNYFSTICSTPEWKWNGKRWEMILDYKLDNEKVREALDELIGKVEQLF